MAIPNLALKRNLRKTLLQGNPWIYRDNLKVPSDCDKTSLCRIKDLKNELVGWGIYSPNTPLAVRVLSLQTKPPNSAFYEKLLFAAKNLRSQIINGKTNAYRLLNGEGDLLPGLICDIYSDTAVLQFDGQSMFEFWDQDWLAQWLLDNTECKTVYFKPRHDSKQKPATWGKPLSSNIIEIFENGHTFLVDIVDGQKTGFFLDQRDNRNYVKSLSSNKNVMNLFSYSGGFSVYAGAGLAQRVTSVDISRGALDLAEKMWGLNSIVATQETVCTDVFEYLEVSKEKFDIVICDPPSLAKSENQKELATNKYIETFSLAAKKVVGGGHLILSSCSSHISFNDFEMIASEAVSKARRRGQTLRISGQGADHPFPQACHHLRYLKFIDLVLN